MKDWVLILTKSGGIQHDKQGGWVSVMFFRETIALMRKRFAIGVAEFLSTERNRVVTGSKHLLSAPKVNPVMLTGSSPFGYSYTETCIGTCLLIIETRNEIAP
jgi:hypothetical protein